MDIWAKEHALANALLPSVLIFCIDFFFILAVCIVFCPFVFSVTKKEVQYDPGSKFEPDVGQALPSSPIR